MLYIVLSKVTVGSFQHVFPIVLAFVFILFLINYSRKNFNSLQKQRAVHYLGWFVSVTLVSFHLYRILFDNYNFKTDLHFTSVV